MYFWKQTLHKDGRGSFWRHARWRFGGLRCEWVWFRWHGPGWRMALGGGDSDRELAVHVHLPLLSIYLGVEVPRIVAEALLPGRPYTFERGGEQHTVKITQEREISFVWHNGGLWWMVWMSPNEWKSTDAAWRRGHFDPLDCLLGRSIYAESILSEHRVLIPMPEKPYPAAVLLKEARWRRPRWPFKRIMKLAEVKPDTGIPFMGKGENSWDCGADGLWGISTRDATIPGAVAATVKSVYASRLRYGIVEPEHAIKA